MKENNKIQRLLLAGLAFASSITICQGASQIVLNTFDNSGELATWQNNGATNTWVNSQDAGGSGTVGCMKVQYPAGSNPWGTTPQRNLGGQSFNQAQYLSVSFDFKIDPSSSLGSDSSAPYGHVQIIPVDNNWSWMSGIGWTAITSDFTNWQHLEIGFVPPYASLNALVVQVGDGGFTSDVIFYIDNLKVNPVPLTNFFNQFTNANEAGAWAWANWSIAGSNQWVSTPDAGGATPTGALKLYNGFQNNPSNYQQVVFTKAVTIDPSRFTYLDLDLRLDPASFPSADGASYGDLNVSMEGLPGYFWGLLGTHTLTASDTNWVHLSFPIAGHGFTNIDRVILQLGRGWSDANGAHGMSNSVIYYVDNIKLWAPGVAPKIVSLRRGQQGGGVQITMDRDGDQYERDGITTPSGGNNYSWYNAGGVTYSFTITNFPDTIAHPGFDVHMYMVNATTCPELAFNETYGAVDWNAADMIDVRVMSPTNGSGGVDFSFRYKTNSSAANPTNLVAEVHAPSAIGTWSVTFGANNTSVGLTGPGGISTNFTLDAAVANRLGDGDNGTGPQMFLNFGAFKDDVVNNGINNGMSATISRIQVIGGSAPLDDTFAGPELTSLYAWRPTASTSIHWIPAGTAWWLSWTVPDEGYSATSSSSVDGPYNDAGVTFSYLSGANRVAAVPTASLPAGSSAFFRLSKPVP